MVALQSLLGNSSHIISTVLAQREPKHDLSFRSKRNKNDARESGIIYLTPEKSVILLKYAQTYIEFRQKEKIKIKVCLCDGVGVFLL